MRTPTRLTTATVLLIGSLADAGELTPGNILVSGGSGVVEFTRDGTWLQTIQVEYPGGRPSGEVVRDVIVSDDGRIQTYNGTFSPYLTSVDAAGPSFTHNSGVGFSTVNNTTFGGISAWGNFAYATDMSTASSVQSGIVRFNLDDSSSLRFGAGNNYTDLTFGLNGSLYAHNPAGALPASSIHVYGSQFLLRTINYPFSVRNAGIRGIAVDRSGSIYAAGFNGTLYKLDSSGGLVDSLSPELGNLHDVDVAADGSLLVGSTSGYIILTNTDLTGFTSFSSPFTGSGTVNVAFVPPRPTPPPPVFFKELVDGPDRDGDGDIDTQIEADANVASEYTFRIVFRQSDLPDACVEDLIPSEWELVSCTADDAADLVITFTADGRGRNRPTQIQWHPTDKDGNLTCVIRTRARGKRYEPKDPGPLLINEGARAVDPASNDPLLDEDGNPLVTNALSVEAVKAPDDGGNGNGNNGNGNGNGNGRR